MPAATLRQEKILAWLKEENTLRIDDLSERLQVSVMTVHRDVDQLAQQNLVEKVHGGLRLPDLLTTAVDSCRLCHMPVQERFHFSINTSDNEHFLACCPHCGLLLLNQTPKVISALVKDFLYGKIVNVHQAYFLVNSRVSLCCEPGLLAFTSEKDALSFQKGFGGQVMNCEEARHYLTHSHFDP
ncbi:copper uptake transcriptional regulator YcnK [Anaerolineales bacterium]